MLDTLSVRSGRRTDLIDITAEVDAVVRGSGIQEGWALVYVPHTTAAVTINERADPAVPRDILMMLNQIVPYKANYTHMEGNSDAHIKATLVGPSEHLIVRNGRLVLGTWQAIFFCEFDGPRSRRVHVKVSG
jgi:secondary thiamine-phosphate synthase enzyme